MGVCISNIPFLSFRFSLVSVLRKTGCANAISFYGEFMSKILKRLFTLPHLPAFRSLAFVVVSSLLLSSPAMASSDYTTSLDTFSAHFYKESVNLPNNKDKNVVLSPISADIVMRMVAYGASGETLQEILKTLCITNLESSTSSLQKTLEDLKNVPGVSLKLANKVFVKESPGKKDNFETNYRSSLQNILKSDIQQINFAASNAAAAEINEWVESKTNNRIKDLISPDSLSSDTVAVLINAIWFKGSWARKFDPAHTQKEDFYLSDGSTVKVDMMFQKAKFLYKESQELDAKIISLPYEKEQVSMVVILPNKRNGIAELEAKLAKSGTNSHLKAMHEVEVSLKLPKFKIETTTNVKTVLQNLGTHLLFSSRADLSKVFVDPEPLYVSEAIQKAFIEVNEEGAEAAAATDVQMVFFSLQLPVEEINLSVDHPFYYEISYGEQTLFSGALKSP